MQEKTINGFSKLSKSEKANWAAQHFFNDPEQVIRDWAGFCHPEEATQKILDGLSENTVSNYHLPYGIAPNFVINGKAYAVPMVIEESSVVAAASSAAKYWMERGGFFAEVLDTKKLGQVHFNWTGDVRKLYHVFEALRTQLLEEATPLTANMEKRGGGIRDIRIIDMTHLETGYYQLMVAFETCDSGRQFYQFRAGVFCRYAATLCLGAPRFFGTGKKHQHHHGDSVQLYAGMLSACLGRVPDRSNGQLRRH